MPDSDRIKYLRGRGLIDGYKLQIGDSDNTPTIYALIKFFDHMEHAEAFRHGQLFFRPLEDFRRYEEQDERGDRFEGSVFYYADPSKIKVTLGGYTLGGMAESPTLAYTDVLYSHTYCMFAVNSGAWREIPEEQYDVFRQSLLLHERVAKFGKYAAVVTNGRKFIRRIDKALLRLKPRNFRSGLVEYFDETSFSGIHDPEKVGFHKRSQYAHQKEFRIMVDLGPHAECPSPKVIDIGDISASTMILPSAQLNEMFEIHPGPPMTPIPSSEPSENS